MAFALPDEVPVGEAEVVLTVTPKREPPSGVDAELWARMLQQEAEGKITIPPRFGEYWAPEPVPAVDGGYVGAVEALTADRESGF